MNNNPTAADADDISESLIGVNNSPTAVYADDIGLLFKNGNCLFNFKVSKHRKLNYL